jgi:hypothetical protein
MPYLKYGGGCGIAPCGQTEGGNSKSDIEPRFFFSRPIDKQKNVPLNQILKFDTYCYSSWIDIVNILIEISEDGGGTWVPAFDGTSFIAPYNNLRSGVIRSSGHKLTFFIQKISNWLSNSRIVIRFTGTDEYGNSATKVTPVTW